jgi:hypothetical protein
MNSRPHPERNALKRQGFPANRIFPVEIYYSCVFHANLDTDSTRSWTPIPRQAGQSAVAA